MIKKSRAYGYDFRFLIADCGFANAYLRLKILVIGLTIEDWRKRALDRRRRAGDGDQWSEVRGLGICDLRVNIEGKVPASGASMRPGRACVSRSAFIPTCQQICRFILPIDYFVAMLCNICTMDV